MIFARISILNFIFLAMLLSACGPIVTAVAAIKNSNSTSGQDIDDSIFMQELAARFGVASILSEVVYYRKEAEYGKTCNMRNSSDDISTASFLGDWNNRGRWIRIQNTESINYCLDHPSGLYYETFAFLNSIGKYEEVYIVFRGTEFASPRDWWSNLSAPLGLQPPQYKVALLEVKKVIEGLSERVPKDVPIYVAGHSLGGGLAQQAAYRFQRVNAAYTFNSSPITNWSYMALSKDNQPEQEWPLIYRIYHTGEILQIARNIATSATSTRYNRFDIGIQVGKKRRFSGHGMVLKSCGLARSRSKSKIELSRHTFSIEAASFFLNSQICKEFREQL